MYGETTERKSYMNPNDKSMMVFRDAPVPKAVFSNIIPSVISMLMVLFYNLADTVFIGQTNDALMVTAVSLATPVFLLFMAIGMLFGIGGTSFISRRLGEGDYHTAKRTSSFCFWGGISIGVICLLGILIFAEPVARAVGASDDSVGYTRQYLAIVAFGIPFLILSNAFSNIIRAEGHPKTAMTGMIIGNLVNIILDPVMILGFGWNVAGAAIATVLGNVVSAVFYIIHLSSKKSLLSIRPKHFTIKRTVSMGVFAIGIPAALNSVLMSTSNIVINKVMANYGDMAVAGLGVAMKVNTIAIMLLIGIGIGVQPLLGFCFGARLRKRYLSILKFTLIVATITSVVMTVICYVFAGPLVEFILKEPEAYAYGFEFSRVYILSGPVIGLLFVMINAIQSTGATIPSLILSLSRQGLIYYPMLFIFTHFFDTAKMAAMTQPVTDYIAATMAVILFIFTFRKYFPKSRDLTLQADPSEGIAEDISRDT